MNLFILFLGILVVLFSFMLSLSRLLNCLMVVEKFKVLLLFNAVMIQSGSPHMFFLTLMVIFTVEMVLGLVVLTRLWDAGDLIFTVGC